MLPSWLIFLSLILPLFLTFVSSYLHTFIPSFLHSLAPSLLSDLAVQRKENAKSFGRERELRVADKHQLQRRKKDAEKRIKVLYRELKRVRKHRHELIDTSVYADGVMQRTRKSLLEPALQKELDEHQVLNPEPTNNECFCCIYLTRGQPTQSQYVDSISILFLFRPLLPVMSYIRIFSLLTYSLHTASLLF